MNMLCFVDLFLYCLQIPIHEILIYQIILHCKRYETEFLYSVSVLLNEI